MYKYKQVSDEFNWDYLGDVGLGRKNLGTEMPVIIYRLMQFTMKNVLNREVGPDKANEIFREAGKMAGKEFYKEKLHADNMDFNAFVSKLQDTLKTYKIGIMKIEKADLETLQLVLTVGEDVDCSGLPVTGESICDYDEGYIAGILNGYTGKDFNVVEVDCWATGDRVCRFNVSPV